MSETYNGPAFPVNELQQQTRDVCVQHFGLTLRDYFAAKAMSGMLANAGNEDSGSWQDAEPAVLANQAYGYADAMLKARLA